MANFDRSLLRTGYHVYSSDDHQIGTISGIGESHFKCDTGFLGLGKDLYIPFSDVTRVENDRVYLDMPKDRVNQMGWDRQPAGWMG